MVIFGDLQGPPSINGEKSWLKDRNRWHSTTDGTLICMSAGWPNDLDPGFLRT